MFIDLLAVEISGCPSLLVQISLLHVVQTLDFEDSGCGHSVVADLFPSFFEDSTDPTSVVGLIVAMHADIGKLIHDDRSHRELRDAAIYFFKWVYVPPTGQCLFGEISLP